MFEPILEPEPIPEQRPEGCSDEQPDISTNCLGCPRAWVCPDHLQVWQDSL
ncbi:hypothetical protein VIOR3934_09023 [Vibrio orientalis CIP 102891 = ATCC 33934]|uniref:Uncharacterized protein n=1 Tax=Vibrio orientalis CIP 102891 = ATCC 33934 TaxID=675816 RepID=C9QJM7_VIBOR|nr:hypothetical protein [Vibrio orientalis]EEX91880.1 hypothetical protein VIA_002522 [Vibrio orientalis CIP 102891 = ATCC 33934]EGU47931.1 hypothetical protein VIOR3934_09023 [Vibrio orientalis CIP 102891 = ATCC 33934]